jgi:hypothetical protein
MSNRMPTVISPVASREEGDGVHGMFKPISVSLRSGGWLVSEKRSRRSPISKWRLVGWCRCCKIHNVFPLALTQYTLFHHSTATVLGALNRGDNGGCLAPVSSLWINGTFGAVARSRIARRSATDCPSRVVSPVVRTQLTNPTLPGEHGRNPRHANE